MTYQWKNFYLGNFDFNSTEFSGIEQRLDVYFGILKKDLLGINMGYRYRILVGNCDIVYDDRYIGLFVQFFR